MKTKKRKGISLMEVMISITIIGILGVSMLSVSMFAFKRSLTLKQQTQIRTEAGANIETAKSEYRTILDLKVRLEEKSRTGNLSALERSQLDSINKELERFNKEQLVLFGKKVDIYSEYLKTELDSGMSLTVNYGLVGSKLIVKPVAVIDSIKITPVGTSYYNEKNMYFGSSIKCTTTIDENTSKYLNRVMYRWYASKTTFVTNDFNGSQYGESSMPLYPMFSNYTLSDGTAVSTSGDYEEIKKSQVSSADTDKLDVKGLEGRFIVCLATPLSINGQFGSSIVSSPIYVSKLPNIGASNYKLVVAPSSLMLDYTDDEAITNISRYSSSIGSSYYLSNVSTNPLLYVSGDNCKISKTVNGRVIRVDSAHQLKLNNSISSSSICAVVKPSADIGVGEMINLANGINASVVAKDDTTGFCVVKTNTTTISNSVRFGQNDAFDIAEFIIVSGSSYTSQVTDYLKEKYGIK